MSLSCDWRRAADAHLGRGKLMIPRRFASLLGPTHGNGRRVLLGSATSLATMAVLTCVMLPLRPYLTIATTALVLVLPVVIGVVIGGFVAGVVSVVAGFL